MKLILSGGGADLVRKKPKTRFLPSVIFLPILPALLVPILTDLHVPDNVLGGTPGFFIGLSIVGFVWMIERSGRGSTDN
jgi:uncharacterized RDD family membrane protein YckC